MLGTISFHIFIDNSIFEQDDTVAEGGGKAVMSHHEDGCFQRSFCLQERINDSAAGFRVKISGRFICEDQKRGVDQCSCNCGPLPFSTGNFCPDICLQSAQYQISYRAGLPSSLPFFPHFLG